MSTNSFPLEPTPDESSIGERNVERLLQTAYHPEAPDPDFIWCVKETLVVTARELAQSRAEAVWSPITGDANSQALATLRLSGGPLSPKEQRVRRLRRALGWTMSAAAAIAGFALFLHAWYYEPVAPVEIAASDLSPDLSGIEHRTPKARPPAPVVARVVVGEMIVTQVGQRRLVQLPDGSTLYVNQSTTVKLSADRLLTLEEGEVFVEVSPRSPDSDAASFTVKTPKRDVIALGTKFAVRAEPNGTSVVVTQGKVRVSGSERFLLAGQQLASDSDRPVPAPRASHLLDWIRELIEQAESPLIPNSKYEGGALIATDPYGQEAQLSLRKYHIDVFVEDGFARTTIDQTYFNHNPWRLEGTFYFPLPPDASLSRLAMYVSDGKECKLMEGGMAERDYARNVYESIVTRQQDPALLEWIDGSTFKMRVFPLEGRQEKRIILSYTQRLASLYGRSSYRFPAGHSLDVVRHWSFHARIKGGADLSWASDSLALKATKDNGDLLLDAAAQSIKIDHDVQVSLFDPRLANEATVRFSSAEQDGARYLMLRYRPLLATSSAKRTSRKDWVFLFESSSQRDPLLARVQIDVIRTILANAEHDDTFAVLTAGTRTQAWTDEPRPVTPENARAAIEFLEQTHLVGALDLGRALSAAEPLLKAGTNPYLVHLGSGIPILGERREEVLARRIPANVHYAGVGVGKRWSRSFMKQAAELSDGYFTQINPDEPISWRAFELVSTLNTPRLLNMQVADPDKQAVFLSYANSVAQGEEFCAIARLESGQSIPETVTIGGTLNGEPIRQTVVVEDVGEHADYLPRTWAKVKIDRLLAENAAQNKSRIVELSTAMYVMTPFTSLLVLENEEMYKQYKVDRGRKDHWAMYPCPEKMPVVFEADPGLASSAPQKLGQNPSVQQVLQSMPVRTPLRFMTLSYDADRLALEGARSFNGDAAGGDFKDLQETVVLSRPISGFRSKFGSYGPNQSRTESSEIAFFLGGQQRSDDNPESAINYNITRIEDISVPGIGVGPIANPIRHDFTFIMGSKPETVRFEQDLSNTAYALGSLQSRLGFVPRGRNDDHRLILIDDSGSMAVGGRDVVVFKFPKDSFNLRLATAATLIRRDLSADHFEGKRRRPDYWTADEMGGIQKNLEHCVDQMTVCRLGMLSYQQSSFSRDERIYSDLVVYAPGMNTNSADVQAVLEVEAAPNLCNSLGRIDANARTLIDKARTVGWQSLTIPENGNQPAFTIIFDGQGRYSYERVLPVGLRERVVCDAKTLVHLYPELGIGARRNVSRFHHAELTRLVPWALPQAEDLAHGADLKSIDERTVAIIPRGAEAAKDSNGKPLPYTRVHLIFDSTGRLAERQAVEMPANKTLYREIYDVGGTVQVLDAGGKELVRRPGVLSAATAPNLSPETIDLVVLPLPYRTREHVLEAFQIEKTPLAELNADAALVLFAADFASRNASEALRLFGERFHGRGIRLLGFYTLLTACGHDVGTDQQYLNVLAEHPREPLAKYLAYYRQPNRLQQSLNDENASRQDFVRRLADFRILTDRWQNGAATAGGLVKRQAERERALNFIRHRPSSIQSWALLSLLQEQLNNDPAECRAVADAWKLLERVPGLSYLAHYEQARCLWHAGQRPSARTHFQDLYAQTFKDGMLPPLDATFRQALQSDAKDGDSWTKLMRQTAATLVADKRRPAVVALAWQCRQLGDQPLGDALIGMALDQMTEDGERLATSLAAIEYLWQTNQYDPIDKVLQPLLANPAFAGRSSLWRLSAMLYQQRGMKAKSILSLERAVETEHQQPAAVLNLQKVRNDYGALLAHYQQESQTLAARQLVPSRDFLAKVIRTADRWRALDRENTTACQLAAKILETLGAHELAWEYLTTPVGSRPNEAAPWLSLAQTLNREREWNLADRAYEAAFEAEATNPQILWDRARNLHQAGKYDESRKLCRQIADGQWQPRFAALQAQARRVVDGR